MRTDQLADFARDQFGFDGIERTVYTCGDGPAVIVMAEIPGITPPVADFARRVAARGHTVYLPSLFGDDGAARSPAQLLKVAPRLCVSAQFRALATRTTAPVIEWLRALARQAHLDCGGPGVGAVGMCFTGGFALAMAADPALIAPVLSQPSLPLGPGASRRADPGCSDADLLAVMERARDEHLCVLGLRFTDDPFVPAERFASLRRALGDAFIGIEIDSSPGNPWGHHRRAHSVLTEDLVEEEGQPTHEALVAVLDFLDERLGTA